ncbi:hypothetical protein ASPZODRAFT_133400 [Penicilliopsis zonata CBS 506.65]|uniref:Peptidase S9 prolyl oligopeptidase catalytic domain-containing protein n=1 Tax=Penicilliopsis zonata CBS 506.65 TaxID=1073090 RepID=A0A1L9SEW5_9EURO|nr:hypothetical protein ASPZODRAFT_133400 [Penicilliopsis zonata CBS 506.65]OJJ45564.1 hypothetical protein ASPZODRAFT_133400 [Penicilliopsis zonata CBS 506.65]
MSRELFPPLPTWDKEDHAAKYVDRDNMLNAWIDPDILALAGDIYAQPYPQPTRGIGCLGTYLCRLPPGYEESEERYPVLFWLHGGMQTSRSCEWALRFYGRKMDEGLMPKCIVIAPQMLPQGRYIDNYDGTRPLATIMSKDLVNAIDRRYRTIRHPSARWIEGFSMGGYGTLHVALTYPEIFGAASALAPAVLWIMEDEPVSLTTPTYGASHVFWDQAHPYYVAGVKRKEAGNMPIRVISGEKDTRLAVAIPRLVDRLRELEYNLQTQHVLGVGHYYEPLLAGVDDFAWTWWQEVAQHIVHPEN